MTSPSDMRPIPRRVEAREIPKGADGVRRYKLGPWRSREVAPRAKDDRRGRS